jgi:hypothetical protein
LCRETIVGKNLTRLPHGIDLKPANLVRSGPIVYLVDIFGPKEITAEGVWKTYNPKLDGLSHQNLLAVCATREGAIIRLIRLAAQSWVSSGSIKADQLWGQLTPVLDQSGIPPHERDFILAEIDNDFPWMNELYSESLV